MENGSHYDVDDEKKMECKRRRGEEWKTCRRCGIKQRRTNLIRNEVDALPWNVDVGE